MMMIMMMMMMMMMTMTMTIALPDGAEGGIGATYILVFYN